MLFSAVEVETDSWPTHPQQNHSLICFLKEETACEIRSARQKANSYFLDNNNFSPFGGNFVLCFSPVYFFFTDLYWNTVSFIMESHLFNGFFFFFALEFLQINGRIDIHQYKTYILFKSIYFSKEIEFTF